MHFLRILDNLLSSDECKNFINIINTKQNNETKKIDIGDYGHYYRTVWINPDFAKIIFERIRPFLPNDQKYVSCNPYFRIAKYDVGGQFKIHKDGFHQNSQGNRSHLTLNIFLNKILIFFSFARIWFHC
jgi:hypothetical protein